MPPPKLWQHFEHDLSQQAASRKTLDVFDEQQHCYTSLSLFPEDRPVPADAINSLQEAQRDEVGAHTVVWQLLVGMPAWQQLQLDQFWEKRLPPRRRARHGHNLPEGIQKFTMVPRIGSKKEFDNLVSNGER